MLNNIIKYIKIGLQQRWFLYVFALFVAFSMFSKSNKIYHWTNPATKKDSPIRSDAFGYYSYLPQLLLFYNQPHFSYIDSLEKQGIETRVNGLGFNLELHQPIDKYYIGTALIYSPFVFCNTIYQKITKGALDGYSYSYQLSTFIGALIYIFLSILLLVHLFEAFKISRFLAYTGVIILYFGTNLGYYATNEFLMSHFPAFFACLLFLYSLKRWTDFNKNKNLYWSAFAFTLLVLIRPVDGLIIFIVPFFFDSWKVFRERISALFQKKQLFAVLKVVGIVAGIIFLQLLTNKYQTGHWFYYSYQNEGLSNILSPEISNILFSFRKGFFIYTPIMFLIFPTWIILFFRKSYFAIGSFVVFCIFIWITASWWQWYYGGSFGMRPIIDIYPLLILIILLAIQSLSTLGKIFFYIPIILGIYVGQVFEYQYNHGIIHYYKMDKAMFWHIFLRKERRFDWYPYRKLTALESMEKSTPLNTLIFNYNSKLENWHRLSKSNKKYELIPSGVSSVFQCKLDSNFVYGVRINGKALIRDEGNLEFISIVYKKNDSTLDSISRSVGMQLLRLNKFEPFIVNYFKAKNIGADALKIYFPAYGKREFKQVKISIDTYNLSSTIQTQFYHKSSSH